LKSGREFQLNVAPSSHPDEDSTSAWRLTGIQAQIPHRHGAELATERRFHFGVAAIWNPDELTSRRGFHFGVAPS